MTTTTDPTKPTGIEGFSQLVVSVGGYAVDGWLLMLALGVLHAERHIVPTFGFWQCFFVVWVLVGIVGSGVYPLTERLRRLGKHLLPRQETSSKKFRVLDGGSAS